jgi:hypothetical protein
MSNQAFAWNNYLLNATLGSNSVGQPVDNLKDLTGAPVMGWQSAAGVTTTAGGAVVTVTPSLTGQIWRAFGVFRTNLTPSATVTFSLASGGSTVWTGQSMGPVAGYQQVVVIAPADTQADVLTVSFDDPSNPDQFINVPLCFAGPMWQMNHAADYSSTFGVDTQADASVTRGGQEYSVMLWERRRWELSMSGILSAEASGPVAELNRVSAMGGNVLFCPDITDPYSLATAAIYGRLTPTSDVGYPYGSSDRRSWKVRVQERL